MNNIIIGTGCYNKKNNGNLVSVTGDGGNAWGFFGNSYKKLAPSLKLWEYYSNNPDKLNEEDLIDYYIKEYYKLRLKDIDIKELLYILKEKFGNNIILMCHEELDTKINLNTFCHRRLIADYIELETGIVIPELNDLGIDTNVYDLKSKIKKLIK